MEQDLKEMNGLPQEKQDLPNDTKPLFSNKVQSRILLVIDLVGLVGILIYCYFIQSYISTFFFFALLLLILLTWQSQVEKVGLYEKNDSTKKIYKSYRNFIQEYQGISENQKNRKTIYENKQQQYNDVSEIQDEEVEKYKPLYWLVYRDSRKFIWITILIISGLSLVMKGTFVGLLNTKPSQTANLMTYQNFEGLEIFFDPTTYKIDAKQYVKIFLPNGIVFVFCCLVMIFRRVNNIKYLEDYQEELNQQVFNIYMILVWVLIAANICTNQSLIGYIFILYQLGFTFRIFCANNVPNSNDLLLVESLKYYILLLMVFLYLLCCPFFVDLYQNNKHAINIELYVGLETIYLLVEKNYWKSYIFGISNLLLFTLLCIMREQINYDQRRKQLIQAVKDCCQNKKDFLERIKESALLRDSQILQRLDSEDNIEQEIEEKQLLESATQQQEQEIPKQDSKSKSIPVMIESTEEHQEQFLKGFNTQISIIGKKIKLFIDQPIITLRLLQLTCITIVILMKTYYSLFIVLWVLISAFTLNSRTNSITSIILAIPGILTNFITFYYQNIPSISDPNSSFQICNSSPQNSSDTDYYCQRFGFFTDPNPFINLLFLDISLGGFILFLKQVTEESQRFIEQRRKQQDKLLKEDKEKKNEKIGWFNLILAVIVRSSYIVSLAIVFYVGFFDVNVIQFVLVLFLLVFLINDSTKCAYQKQTKKGVETIAVPFAFKYWVLFVIYMSLINLVRYIYLLFYEDSSDAQNSKSVWILQLIGIDKNKYEIIFWILFYFVALQYDSYKSSFYLKYQNKLFDKFMDQIERKQSIKDTKQLILRLQLLFLKGVIWLSFTINLCFLIFSPFSFINTFLLVFVGFIFVYYTITVTTNVNYSFMSTIWYVYLNILILTFIIRYLFQFICIPDYSDIKNSNLINLYDKLMKNYQEYGLYQYDTARLRLEYFPDMLTIFFGALSLNTYRILTQSQKEQKLLLSESELGSGIEEDDQINKMDKLQREEVREYAKLMQISILDDWQWLKQPILFLAQINTDILTLYVVISVVFYIRNIAAFILLILYLSYFLTVHHELLNKMQNNQLLNKLVQQIGAMKAKYIQFDKTQQLDNEDNQIRVLVSQIKFTRMKIRIQKKRLIWQISFSFTAFCIFLTYFSQYLSIYDNDPDNKFISNASISLFVFGTFAQEKNSDAVCFCGPNSNAPSCSATGQQTTSNILNAVLFYMILLFANVLDTGCTMILEEELEKDKLKVKDKDRDRDQNQDQDQDKQKQFTQEAQDEKDPRSVDQQKIDIFLSKHPYLKLEILEQYDQPQLIDRMEVRREAVILNYYFNKSQILRLKIYSALFSIFQRMLVLILLFNTIIVNNIFSLVYLIVTTILFLRPNGITNLKILNIFAVVAIWLQFSLYLLNLTPNQDDLPTKSTLTVDQYSIVDSLGPNLKTYLGFSNGDLMDCNLLKPSTSSSTLIFNQSDCQSNQYLNWVFLINTFVISLIYVYFLIVQFLSNQVIQKADEMEKNQEETIEFLCIAMKYSKIKVKVNFQVWKDKSYTFYQLLSSWVLKNNHMIILALVIMLSQTNRVIFNLLELFAGLVFFAITQFYFKFPKTKDQNQFEISYLKWLFYLPVLTVASFTILKLPELLDHCAAQNQAIIPDPSLIFLCSQIFDIRIAGMVWIMFFISLHFDLEQSQDHHDLLDKLQNQSDQKARMISLALAYNKNHKKYKSMLKAQSQKAIFQFIQEKTQEKLKIWHQKLLDQNNQKEQMQEEAIEQALLESKVEEATEKELVSEAPGTTDFQKQLIGAIKKIQSFNDRFKYMGQVNLMDYILSQNQILQRKINLSIEDFLKRDYTKFNSELEFIQIFYNRAYDQVGVLKTFNLNVKELIKFAHLKMITNRKAGSRRRQGAVGNVSMIGSGLVKSDQVDEIPQIKFTANPQMVSFIDFNSSKNLSFITIQDKSNIIFLENTKYSAQLPELTTFRLVLKLIQEILRLVISNWISFCYLMIIFYYAKNSGLLGGFLPFLLFTWVLIDERATSKIFWVLAYVVFSITSIVIFCYSLTGLLYVMKYNNPNLEMGLIWYFPLYDAGYDLVFEIFLIWFIILQIYLSQKNGVYYKSLQEIENIFQGYVRVKLNKFNQYFRQEIVMEERKKNIDPSNQNQKLINQGYQEVLMQDDNQQMLGSVKSDQNISNSQQKQYESKITESVRIQEELITKEKQDEEEREKFIQPLMKKASNNLEKRILMDTTLITGGDHGLFERVFSFKFTRPGIDLYTITAFIQIIIILYTILFFSSMVNDGVNINNIIKTNQIPGSLIIALLIEIILMVAERYITLKDSVQIFEDEQQNQNGTGKETKSEDEAKKEENNKKQKQKKSKQSFTQKYKTQFLMKFALQLVMICLIFWFIFIYLGAPWQVQNDTTRRNSEDANIPQIYFKTNGFVKCFFILYCAYFTVSALQLRVGYQQLKLRNTFLRSYNQVSNVFAKVFYAIPFLFELKVLMDWTFLETSLDVFQWFRLEDITGLMYFTKIQSKGYVNTPLGKKQPKIMKWGFGCTFVLFILLCILGPLILFSSFNPSSQLNLVTGGEFLLSITNVQTGLNVQLYSTNQLQGLENQLTDQEEINFALNQTSTNPIINQAPQTGALQEFQLLSYANNRWAISNPLFESLLVQMNESIFNGTSYFVFNFTYTFTRDQQKIIPQKNSFCYPGNAYLATYPGQNQTYLNVAQLQQLYNMLTDCSYLGNPLPLPSFYVQTLQLYSPDGTTFKPKPINNNGIDSVQNVSINLQCAENTATITNQTSSWWSLLYDGVSTPIIQQKSSQGLIFFIVSDKFSPLTYGFSIITIYTSVILLIGTFIRSLFSGQVWLLEYYGMVYPDDLLMICEAISIARSQKDLKRENLLYFELIDILRSPEIVKVMTGSWSQVFKKIEEEKLKQD